jgi:hypothetical protein
MSSYLGPIKLGLLISLPSFITVLNPVGMWGKGIYVLTAMQIARTV